MASECIASVDKITISPINTQVLYFLNLDFVMQDSEKEGKKNRKKE
jgi:hypothetical protein